MSSCTVSRDTDSSRREQAGRGHCSRCSSGVTVVAPHGVADVAAGDGAGLAVGDGAGVGFGAEVHVVPGREIVVSAKPEAVPSGILDRENRQCVYT